jgi:hypothetical protein
MIELMVFIGVVFYLKAIILAIYIYTKHKHLTSWLQEHAEMTWETYKRLGLTGCNCTGDCRQGRDCPKR